MTFTRDSKPNFSCCPYCGQQMLIRFGVKLTPKKALIFDLIHDSGERGVMMDVLCWVFYADKSIKHAKDAVSVTISQINDFLSPTTIRIGKRHNSLDEPYRVLKEDEVGSFRPRDGTMRKVRRQADARKVGI